MANSLSGKLKGGKYKQKLQFVPDADNEPKVGHEISEPAIFRFLLNEETLEKFDEAAEVEIAKMLDVLKDIDKQSKITLVEAYQSSMNPVTDTVKAFHVFIVFNSTSETADDGVYWWSLEKNSKYIVLQRSRIKNNVKEKLEGKPRTRVKLIEKDLKGKGTIKDLFEILWAHQVIPEKYHIYNSNCQFLVTFVGEQITEIGYKYKGNFPYSPPPEKGRDKQMLELINVIRGCSDWSPLFHLIKMGSTDLVDKTVASGKYDINALYNGLTPLHFAIILRKTKMVQHLLEPPMNADPTKRDASGKSALLLAVSISGMKEEIIDLLLAHEKVNVDDVDENGRTALHWAADRSNVVAVRKLIEKGANPNVFDKWGNSPLHRAAQNIDDKEIIYLLLAHGKVMIDHADENGFTALHWAARLSKVVAVQKLLEKGANPNIFDKWGRSPLDVAVLSASLSEKNDKKIMDLLLAHDKVNVDDVDGDGQTALHLAAYVSNVIAVRKLLKRGANPNIIDKEGQSPLHSAAQRERNGNEHSLARRRRGQSKVNEIMDLLLAHSNVKVDDVDEHGQTALHFAAYNSNVKAVKYLINKGANPNAVDKSGDSPLHAAAVMQRFGNRFLIDLLLEAQKVKGLGDVNDQNKQGRTALHYAAAYSNEITAKHLIKKGADVNCRTNVGDTPLHYAALGAKDMKIIDLLLQNIINEIYVQQYRNNQRLFFFARHNVHGLGNTILYRFVENGIKPPCTETDHCTGESDDEATGVNTRRFEDKGADPSIDLTGFDDGLLDFLIARVKISLGIYDDINGRDQNGETPLLVAIRANYVNAVRNLLEKGADPTIRNNDGHTPLHQAVDKAKDFEILNSLLSSEKVDVNEKTGYGETALHMAIERSNTATAGFLLSKGANPNVTDIFGRTPLHLAARNARNMDIVELLLNHKDVDVNLMNEDGSSALCYTKQNKHGLGDKIANLLKEKGAVKRELPKRNNESLEKLLNYTSGNAAYEIESVLSDAKVPNENKIARIKQEHLISAIIDSDVESVRRLLKNGADFISKATWGEDGENALHVASKYAKTTDLIGVILETGKFDINGVDNKGDTPLHLAIKSIRKLFGTNAAINARHLIRKGADLNIANAEGDTPLHLAARYAEEIETISLILENEQVDINSRGNNERTPLHHAIGARKPNTARYLLKKGADLNVADENGATPLHLAAKEDYYETTELIDIILETGKCNINGVDNYGRTPLHYAIEKRYPVTINVRRLIEMGADPGIADKDGVTPLHMAARNADADSMDLIDELLLKVKTGAVDVNCVDYQGRTVLSCARDNKHGLGRRIIARLKEYGAKE